MLSLRPHKTLTLCVLLACFVLVSCMGRGPSKKSQRQAATVAVQAGTRSPALGLGFDVSYNPATDGIVPGYRLLQVGLSNNSLNVIQLDPLTDRWYVVDRKGHQHEAILNLRQVDPDVWEYLPRKLRRLIEYPLLVTVGATQAIDLLIPADVRLDGFRQVVFESPNLDKIIRIYARESTE